MPHTDGLLCLRNMRLPPPLGREVPTHSHISSLAICVNEKVAVHPRETVQRLSAEPTRSQVSMTASPLTLRPDGVHLRLAAQSCGITAREAQLSNRHPPSYINRLNSHISDLVLVLKPAAVQDAAEIKDGAWRCGALVGIRVVEKPLLTISIRMQRSARRIHL